MEMKKCSHCGVEKPVAEFQKNRAMADGYGNQCKVCHNRYTQKYRQDPAYLAREKENHARWYRDKLALGGYDLQSRASVLKRKYGISLNEYVAMLVKQDQKCAICGSPSPNREGADSFDVDHNHATGAIRGLLCKDCNLTIGNAKENPTTLRKAAEYLEKHQ